jgi:thiol-disulfide isomerase/thioredoxin
MSTTPTIVLFVLFSFQLTAQGIEFFTGSWDEALAAAEAENKLIFVDAYADWCAPCKLMDRQVFPQQEVGSFFNEHFINVQYDMEKAESADFRRTHSATAYPTLLFIGPDNVLVHRVVGARQSAQLIRDGEVALSKVDRLEQLQTSYEATPSAETAYPYVRALIRKGEPHLRVANEELRRPGTDFTAPATLRLIYVSATEADSRIFDLLLKHRQAIAELYGREEVGAQARRAVRATFDKGLEYRSEDLLATAADKLSRLDPEAGKRLAYEADLAYAQLGSDQRAVIKAAKIYLRKGAAGDADRLRRLASDLRQSDFINYTQVIDLVVDAYTAAAEVSEEGWRDYYRLAQFLQDRQRYEQALKAAETALERLGPDGQANYRRAVQHLVDGLSEAAE